MRDVLTALPKDDWEIPRKLLGAYGPACDQLAFLILRPEALRQGQAKIVLEHAARAGLHPVEAEVIHPHPRQVEELYRYTQVSMMDAGKRPMWWHLSRYYALGPIMVVLLRCDSGSRPAADILSGIKGPSNPALTRPGQIRFECRSQNMIMCVVHSSDDTRSVLREACVFLGADCVGRAIERAVTATTIDVTPLLRAHDLPVSPTLLPTFHQALAALQIEVLAGPAISRDPVLAAPARLVREALRERYDDELANLDYVTRTEGLRSAWDIAGQRFLDLLAGCLDDALVFLRWSALLRDTISAYSEIVINRLSDLGYPIDEWSAIVLELGWAFHDMIEERLPPTENDSTLADEDFGQPERMWRASVPTN